MAEALRFDEACGHGEIRLTGVTAMHHRATTPRGATDRARRRGRVGSAIGEGRIARPSPVFRSAPSSAGTTARMGVATCERRYAGDVQRSIWARGRLPI